MTFGAPWALWSFLAIGLGLLALLCSWRTRLRISAGFGLQARLDQLVVGKPTGWRIAKGTLWMVGLCLTALALARPQYGSRSLVLRKRGVDVVIALDFSKSMLAQDVQPSRIERAKAEVVRFIEELGGDRVGVVAFAGDTMQFPMTSDYAAIRLFFRDLNPYDMPIGGTAIGRALTAAKQLLERSAQATNTAPRPDQVVLLITDGEDHEGEPLRAAKALADHGARLYVIGIGSGTPQRLPAFAPDGTIKGYLTDEGGRPVTTALSAANERQLKQLARVTGGKYFRAGKGSAGIDKIRKEVRALKHAERANRRITQHEDRYALILLAAFLLLVLEGLLPEARLSRELKQQGLAPHD